MCGGAGRRCLGEKKWMGLPFFFFGLFWTIFVELRNVMKQILSRLSLHRPPGPHRSLSDTLHPAQPPNLSVREGALGHQGELLHCSGHLPRVTCFHIVFLASIRVSNSLLVVVHSFTSRSSKCISTAQARRNWWAGEGAFLDCALVVASCAFAGLVVTFPGRCRGNLVLWRVHFEVQILALDMVVVVLTSRQLQ